MNEEQKAFKALAEEIMSQGYDQATAIHYASLISDTPTADEQGNIVVVEQGQVIARLKPLKFFGD